MHVVVQLQRVKHTGECLIVDVRCASAQEWGHVVACVGQQRDTIVSGALRGVSLPEQRGTEGRLWPREAEECQEPAG